MKTPFFRATASLTILAVVSACAVRVSKSDDAAAPAATAAAAPAPTKQVFPSPGRAGAMLTPGILVGNTFYVSGQLPAGAYRDSAIGPQTRSAITAAQNILQAAGLTLADVVQVTVYLTNGADFQGMNAAYTAMFTADPRPTRTTVVVAALVSAGAKMEITMTAVKK